MNKKRLHAKLRLGRETVRELDLGNAVGGFGSSSDQCTQSPNCTHGTSAAAPTFCICARCPG